MGALTLLLTLLNATNQATPGILALIAHLRDGKQAGKTDEQILAEAQAVIDKTRKQTEIDMGPQA